MRLFRGSLMSRRSTKVCLQINLNKWHWLFASHFQSVSHVPSSPASRSDAAEAGELLPNHYCQTDQPLHPVHRQSQRETWAQVLDSGDVFPAHSLSAVMLIGSSCLLCSFDVKYQLMWRFHIFKHLLFSFQTWHKYVSKILWIIYSNHRAP